MLLIPMAGDDFASFVSQSVAGYAQDLERTYGVRADLALESATEDFNATLPDGLETEDHHFFRLCSLDGLDVGIAWIGIQREEPMPAKLFIYDLEIHQAFRRQGWGRRALTTLEQWAVKRGVSRMELNVFAHNEAAQALYRGMGMQTCEMTMGKDLRGGEA